MDAKDYLWRAGGLFGEACQSPERGVNSQRSIHGYVVQSAYGFFVGAEILRIVDFHLEQG